MGKPPLRTRATLLAERLAAFANWAEARGYQRETPKGGEVLRLRREPRPPLLYYPEADGERVQCIGIAATLVHEWLSERDRQRNQQEGARA